MVIAYLGPEGTFTHAASGEWLAGISSNAEQRPYENAARVIEAVESSRVTHGVIPIENTIEGVVVPSLDGLLAAHDAIAIGEVVLPISFDAFVTSPVVEPDTPVVEPVETTRPTEVVAHPHALAQCSRFIAKYGLTPVPTSSNAAACRDLRPGQVALGPADCGQRYGLSTLATAVEDYHGALTRFLVLAKRSSAGFAVSPPVAPPVETQTAIRTMLAVTPQDTGPGVLARISNAFGGLGVNMSSLVTRPVKARSGQYVFVVTFDAAPWEAASRAVFEYLLSAGDALKVLAIYEVDPQEAALDAVLPETIPFGSVTGANRVDTQKMGRALFWGPLRAPVETAPPVVEPVETTTPLPVVEPVETPPPVAPPVETTTTHLVAPPVTALDRAAIIRRAKPSLERPR